VTTPPFTLRKIQIALVGPALFPRVEPRVEHGSGHGVRLAIIFTGEFFFRCFGAQPEAGGAAFVGGHFNIKPEFF